MAQQDIEKALCLGHYFLILYMDTSHPSIELAMLSEELTMASPRTKRKFDRLLDRMAHLNMSVEIQRKILHCLLSEQAEEERMDAMLKPTINNNESVFRVAFPAPECDEFEADLPRYP